MTVKPSLLVYLHGFNSSPLSHKAMVMKTYCETCRPDVEVLVPQLPSYPAAAAEFLDALIQRYQQPYRIGIMGSSLGGYYAAWVNAQFGLRAVLVNPAVKPYELLADYLGEQQNPYTHECYCLTEQHIDELKQLDIEVIAQPESVWTLLQTGDEVLDYHQAVTHFSACKKTIEHGGNHAFTDFERYAAEVIEFLQL